MEIKINIMNSKVKIPDDIVEAADGDELLGRIFYNRGYRDPDTVRQMLHDELYIPVDAWDFHGMQEAVDRIDSAVRTGESILVYGDYDVDGVTSTVTLIQCLRNYTDRLAYHVPDRFAEGYGMNEEVVRKYSEKGFSLIITCDCGISNMNEISLAKRLGMDVIITDHHNIPDELPPADVILNPKMLGKGHRASNLSGCGMAYFLCLALLKRHNMEIKAEELLDLLALSLVADVVSLNGENRHLLKIAMPRLFETKRTGLRQLFNIIEKYGEIRSEEDIAFQIAPRLNAAGRMESAKLPVELLLSNDSAEASEMAQKIDFLNNERKRIQLEIQNQAFEIVENEKKNRTVLVLFKEFWHHGIIGIAAGKVCEAYHKPAVLLTSREDGNIVVGSARSIDEIDIYDLIKKCRNRLLKFGGHAAAAGLSLKREELGQFTQEIERLAEEKYHISSRIMVNTDAELEISRIDNSLCDRLDRAGPYGEGFETPCFLTRNLTVTSDRITGRNHHMMVLEAEDGSRISAVKWNSGKDSYLNKTFDMTYKIGRKVQSNGTVIKLTVEYLADGCDSRGRPYEGRFTDERSRVIGEVLGGYKEYLVFYEGFEDLCPVPGTVDRYGIVKTDNLVFLSVPVNSAVFREVVSLASPRNIILNFSVIPEYSFKGFMTSVMGIIKHTVLKSEGRTSLEAMSIMLCVEESMIIASLKYLKSIGMIEFSAGHDGELLVLRGGRADERNRHSSEKNLKNALDEKAAYLKFILSLDAESFREYLK